MEAQAEIARLNRKIKRLSALIEVNALINSSLDRDTSLENVMAISVRVRI